MGTQIQERTGGCRTQGREEAGRPDAALEGRRIHTERDLTRRGVGSGDGEKNRGRKVGRGPAAQRFYRNRFRSGPGSRAPPD